MSTLSSIAKSNFMEGKRSWSDRYVHRHAPESEKKQAFEDFVFYCEKYATEGENDFVKTVIPGVMHYFEEVHANIPANMREVLEENLRICLRLCVRRVRSVLEEYQRKKDAGPWRYNNKLFGLFSRELNDVLLQTLSHIPYSQEEQERDLAKGGQVWPKHGHDAKDNGRPRIVRIAVNIGIEPWFENEKSVLLQKERYWSKMHPSSS